MRDLRSRESNEKMKPEKAQRYNVLRGEMTARQICEACGYQDMNMVRPRLTELVQQGVLEKYGTKYDPLTDRKVTAFRKVQPAEAPKPKPVVRHEATVVQAAPANCDQMRLFA